MLRAEQTQGTGVQHRGPKSKSTQGFVKAAGTGSVTKMALPITGRKTASAVSMDGAGLVLAATVSPPGWYCIFWLKTSAVPSSRTWCTRISQHLSRAAPPGLSSPTHSPTFSACTTIGNNCTAEMSPRCPHADVSTGERATSKTTTDLGHKNVWGDRVNQYTEANLPIYW